MHKFSALLLLALPFHAWCGVDRAQDIKCNLAEDMQPAFSERLIDTHCAQTDNPECNLLLKKITAHATKIRAEVRLACETVGELERALADTITQKDAPTRQVAILKAAHGKFDALLRELTFAYEDVKGQMPKVLPPATVPLGIDLHSAEGRKALIRETYSKDDQMLHQRFRDMRWASDPAKDTLNDRRLFGGQNGFVFLRNVVKNKREAQKTQSDITSMMQKTEAAAQKMDQPDPRDRGPASERPPANTVTSGGGGLDMKTLMGLATAGMGLAQMMKAQEAKDTATETEPPIPGPGDTKKIDAPGKAEVQASKFAGEDKNKEPGGSPIKAIFPEAKKDVAAKGHIGPPAYNEGSDISKRSDKGPMNGHAVLNPAKAGGPSGGGGPSGESGSPSHGGGKGDQASHGDKHDDEAMQGIGGGGLGGGGPSGGGSTPSASDPAAAGGEDPMKDLLHEMKDAAAEGDSPGDENAGDTESGVADMDSLDLFPRVRACHVRSLKQGKVLNGLGDRIQPD